MPTAKDGQVETVITIDIPTKTSWPGTNPFRRLAETRALTVRQAEALTRLTNGALGRPLSGGGSFVNSPERAVKFLLDRIADQLGL